MHTVQRIQQQHEQGTYELVWLRHGGYSLLLCLGFHDVPKEGQLWAVQEAVQDLIAEIVVELLRHPSRAHNQAIGLAYVQVQQWAALDAFVLAPLSCIRPQLI